MLCIFTNCLLKCLLDQIILEIIIAVIFKRQGPAVLLTPLPRGRRYPSEVGEGVEVVKGSNKHWQKGHWPIGAYVTLCKRSNVDKSVSTGRLI